MNNKSKLVTAALTGILLASSSCGSSSNHTSTHEIGECHGVNSCKGKSDCGGKGHGCAGLNTCKGKGWKKMSQSDCDNSKGEFVKI
jgi:uncharacterized membrane protein